MCFEGKTWFVSFTVTCVRMFESRYFCSYTMEVQNDMDINYLRTCNITRSSLLSSSSSNSVHASGRWSRYRRSESEQGDIIPLQSEGAAAGITSARDALARTEE